MLFILWDVNSTYLVHAVHLYLTGLFYCALCHMKLIFYVIVLSKFVSRSKGVKRERMIYAFNFAQSYSQYFAKHVLLFKFPREESWCPCFIPGRLLLKRVFNLTLIS